MKLTIFYKIYLFYKEGFASMTVGKTLWIIILVKLFVIFIILKLFFFHDVNKSKYLTDKEKSNYVLHQLTNKNSK
jgi:hypothetical protein